MSQRILTPGMLSERLKTIRVDRFGKSGAPLLAMRIGLPVGTWINYETGCNVPAHVLLKFIEVANASPLWLLRGEGDRYNSSSSPVD
jgi:hypothetical protein